MTDTAISENGDFHTMRKRPIREKVTVVAGQRMKVYSRDGRLWASSPKEHDEAWRALQERALATEPIFFRSVRR